MEHLTPEAVELLPCPNPWCFSSSAPVPVGLNNGRGNPAGWRVCCACGVQTFRTTTRRDAITLWNHRPELARLEARIALLSALPLSPEGGDEELAKRLEALVILDEVGSNNPLGKQAAARLRALSGGRGSSSARSQPCGEASADAEVFAGLNAEPSAAWVDLIAEQFAKPQFMTTGPDDNGYTLTFSFCGPEARERCHALADAFVAAGRAINGPAT